MKSLNNFAALEITSTEEVKGGTFGLFSLLSLCAPKPVVCQPAPKPTPAPCYTAPAPSCNTGGYTTPTTSCTPKPTTCNTGFSFSLNFSLGGCR
ncbi:hypothetical protein LV89_04422 [Arcicella aurantiaca]|uniref:Uncharacterized protein n=1 Tax=Arcicella aurantiaca TaxID=591202 RepID=A0A316DGJ7_9BACT|nr:hypothetical protein [Arcicella aurantiaca]PWK17321.1 hypothetical protein LV89_04422 [Arcicella aurantiaca]